MLFGLFDTSPKFILLTPFEAPDNGKTGTPSASTQPLEEGGGSQRSEMSGDVFLFCRREPSGGGPVPLRLDALMVETDLIVDTRPALAIRDNQLGA